MRNLFGQVDGTVNPEPGTADFDRRRLGGRRLAGRGHRRRDPPHPHGPRQVGPARPRPAARQSVGRNLANGAPLTGANGARRARLRGEDRDRVPRHPGVRAHPPRPRRRPRERIFRRALQLRRDAGGSAASRIGAALRLVPGRRRRQFMPMQQRLDELDLLNEWTTPDRVGRVRDPARMRRGRLHRRHPLLTLPPPPHRLPHEHERHHDRDPARPTPACRHHASPGPHLEGVAGAAAAAAALLRRHPRRPVHPRRRPQRRRCTRSPRRSSRSSTPRAARARHRRPRSRWPSRSRPPRRTSAIDTLVAVRPAPEPGDTTRIMFTGTGLGESETRVGVRRPGHRRDPRRPHSLRHQRRPPVRTWVDHLHRNLHLGEVGRLYSELAASWLGVVALAGARPLGHPLPQEPAGPSRTSCARTTRSPGTGGSSAGTPPPGSGSSSAPCSSRRPASPGRTYGGANVDKLRAALDWGTPAVDTALTETGGPTATGEHAPRARQLRARDRGQPR